MSRVSRDEYRIIDGVRVLWNGYDYNAQHWVFEGKRDTRTLEELQASIQKKDATLYHHSEQGSDISNDTKGIKERQEAMRRASAFVASL